VQGTDYNIRLTYSLFTIANFNEMNKYNQFLYFDSFLLQSMQRHHFQESFMFSQIIREILESISFTLADYSQYKS